MPSTASGLSRGATTASRLRWPAWRAAGALCAVAFVGYLPVDAGVTSTLPSTTRNEVATLNGNALLSVQDSGPGMTADEQERVFERFYRADPSRARASGGVGLGLSIVSAVAEAHGGEGSVRSEPGKGSTFVISLPLYPDS